MGWSGGCRPFCPGWRLSHQVTPFASFRTTARVQVLANAFAEHGVHVAAIQEGRWRTLGCSPVP
eukprot:3969207-Prorocentrum_lima.AAC.1